MCGFDVCVEGGMAGGMTVGELTLIFFCFFCVCCSNFLAICLWDGPTSFFSALGVDGGGGGGARSPMLAMSAILTLAAPVFALEAAAADDLGVGGGGAGAGATESGRGGGEGSREALGEACLAATTSIPPLERLKVVRVDAAVTADGAVTLKYEEA